ncbi:MAG: ABC transporter permease [Rhodospirillales bacterium]|nr:MAG: ABC transporter permease [Rhodospirillales bacterium]
MRASPLFGPSRRQVLRGAGAAAVATLLPRRFAAAARPAPVRIGLLLPYSGTYAMLGTAITDGLKLRLAEAGETLAGRPVDYIAVDSEASPPQAPQNTRKLVVRDRVDFLVGPVHSGVALAMAQIVAARGGPIMIIPNAGANALTRELCARNVFRASFSNWQTGYPCGKVMADDGHRRIVTITWRYAAGDEIMGGGAEHFEALGGRVDKHIRVPFPDVSFQPHLSEIAALAPDAVFAFFSGGGAVQFVRDYAAAGLKDRIPLYGPGFLTEGVAAAQGAAADGIRSTLHYVDDLDLPANRRFRDAYRLAYGREADVFAVQGYDTGTLIVQAMAAVDGDTAAVADIARALEGARLDDSPRGPWRMSPAHNPVQTFYLRDVQEGRHRFLGIAAEALADPAIGCALG